MNAFSSLFLAGFHMEGSKAAIIAAIQAAGEDAKAQEAVRAEVRRGVFARRFAVKCVKSGLPTIASVNATDAILAKLPSQLNDEEKTVHTAFRKTWSRLLEAANVDSTDARAKGNKGKNAGKKKPGAQGPKPVEATTNAPAPIVAAPVAEKGMADIEAYALQQATTFQHYVQKNAKAFRGAKGSAMQEAFREFTRKVRAAALIKDDEAPAKKAA